MSERIPRFPPPVLPPRDSSDDSFNDTLLDDEVSRIVEQKAKVEQSTEEKDITIDLDSDSKSDKIGACQETQKNQPKKSDVVVEPTPTKKREYYSQPINFGFHFSENQQMDCIQNEPQLERVLENYEVDTEYDEMVQKILRTVEKIKTENPNATITDDEKIKWKNFTNLDDVWTETVPVLQKVKHEKVGIYDKHKYYADFRNLTSFEVERMEFIFATHMNAPEEALFACVVQMIFNVIEKGEKKLDSNLPQNQVYKKWMKALLNVEDRLVLIRRWALKIIPESPPKKTPIVKYVQPPPPPPSSGSSTKGPQKSGPPLHHYQRC